MPGMNLRGKSASLMLGVAEHVNWVDERYDVHTVQVVADNGAFRVTIDSTDDDMEDVRHEIWLNNYGGVITNIVLVRHH